MAVPQKVQVWSKRDEALLLECSWYLLKIPSTGNPWQSLDIVFRHVASSNAAELFDNLDDVYVLHLDENAPKKILPESFGSLKAFRFFLQCLRATTASRPGFGRVAKLIIPLQKGHIVRSDIVPLRLRDFQYVETASSFAEPLESYNGCAIALSDACDLPALFSAATAGLLLYLDSEHDSDAGFEALSLAVESELENRLSLPWILPGTARCRTLVLVDGNSAHPDKGGTGYGFYLAAIELGINLVVLENAGHWLEGPDYAHWREAFIPTRLTNPPEEDLADRIVESVKAYGKPVDGIVTFADSFWVYIAQAAQQLGLRTSSQDAFRIATNKYLTSVFVGHEAYRASSLGEALDIAKKTELPYPLIVKPCDGWSSEGVSRVDSLDELTTAVESIDTSRHGSEFVMEKYCAGPEVDANFVLLDGEVLFFEVCDDFPKSADINGPSVGSLTNFHELNSVYPSALPSREIDLLRNSFLDTLLKLGLKDGIMHLEGRVEYSSVEYKTTQYGGLDLCPCDDSNKPTNQQPTAWLIEINPRPLGMTGSQIIESTYGIDYWGLALLIAVGDKPRVRALSQPFKHGAQYTCVMVFIPADYPSSCQGIFDSEDICADLMARRPDLAKHISRCACLVKRGQKVPHPSSGVNSFLAYFNVFSRAGRNEALDLARQVREEVRYWFV
ncbi:glutathione synthetase ATP-binding domain-like protein [Lepidopterella palustris CBS 459.81]|uniref:Glutathione synthetase ATP-binding domain-like protein n=1 Tax=Lepidopterella palustris CBS 459.81 TaxID=1314670 RepID=A0A8E2DZC0_9PEZI|nr:glutathione synthetase ATP-binding domain-like protein [Lepidopterella palustris CBS 459.81]